MKKKSKPNPMLYNVFSIPTRVQSNVIKIAKNGIIYIRKNTSEKEI